MSFLMFSSTFRKILFTSHFIDCRLILLYHPTSSLHFQIGFKRFTRNIQNLLLENNFNGTKIFI